LLKVSAAQLKIIHEAIPLLCHPGPAELCKFDIDPVVAQIGASIMDITYQLHFLMYIHTYFAIADVLSSSTLAYVFASL
jgi:hypothetical protein